jgi:hypothetical protein
LAAAAGGVSGENEHQQQQKKRSFSFFIRFVSVETLQFNAEQRERERSSGALVFFGRFALAKQINAPLAVITNQRGDWIDGASFEACRLDFSRRLFKVTHTFFLFKKLTNQLFISSLDD